MHSSSIRRFRRARWSCCRKGGDLWVSAAVVFVAAAVSLGFPSSGEAQEVDFVSDATVSYSLQGLTRQSGHTDVTYADGKSLSTSSPLAEPVLLNGSIGGTLGSGGSSSSMFANVTAEGSAGLMRAVINGSTSAAWTGTQTSTGELSTGSNVIVSWTDAYIVMGNPANPQPGRSLLIHALLNVSGSMQYTLTEPALEYGFNPGFSNISMALDLAAHDHLGRSLIPGNQSGVERDTTSPSNFPEPAHVPPPSFVAVELMANEGQIASMRFEMQVRAHGQSSTSTQWFGDDYTDMTFDANFGHTVSWGGITSVTDVSTGLPVSTWSITSASGADYAVAVPEPAALGLVAVPVLALLRRRRAMPASENHR